MGKPRFHRKSRSGCLDCKTRRVKCDESKPVCERCQRTGRACIYQATSRRPLPQPSPSPSPLPLPSPAAPPAPAATSGQDCVFDPIDLSLMAHYTTSTALDLFPSSDAQRYWQRNLPWEAQSQPHLMHGILALAATDMARKVSQSQAGEWREQLVRFRRRALHHQQRGLAMFQDFLSGHRTGSSLENLFIFATMLIISTSAYMLIDDRRPTLNDFLALFALFRGGKELFKLQGHGYDGGPIHRMLCPREKGKPPPSLHLVLDMISDFATKQDKPVHHEAASQLLHGQGTYTNSQFDIRAVGFWPSMFSKEFYELLNDQDPAALAVLARYSFTLAAYNHWWWIGDMGQLLLLAIDHALTADGKTLIGWDLDSIQSQQASLIQPTT